MWAITSARTVAAVAEFEAELELWWLRPPGYDEVEEAEEEVDEQ